MAVIEAFGYALNEKIIYDLQGVYDVGGSTGIHTYGAYFGLTVCLIAAARSDQNKPVE